MNVHSLAAKAILVSLVISFATGIARAETMRARYRAEEVRFRSLIASICSDCDASHKPLAQDKRLRVALIDPIAVLQASPRTSANSRTAAATVLSASSTVVADRTLASLHHRHNRTYAQLLKRRRYAKLLRARRYAALAVQRNKSSGTQAAAAQYAIQFGQIQRAPN
jgi:hypothetical protein